MIKIKKSFRFRAVLPNLFWLAPPFLTNKFILPPTAHFCFIAPKRFSLSSRGRYHPLWEPLFELCVMSMTQLISILIGFHIAYTELVQKAKNSYDDTS